MSKTKLDGSLAEDFNQKTDILNEFLNNYPEIGATIVNRLSAKEALHLPTLSKDLNNFFQPHFDRRTAAFHVVEGNVDSLKRIFTNYPSWLFAIYSEITAPRGQKYFNLSLFQLIIFLCDDDMKTQIMGLDSVVAFLEKNEKWQEIRKQQYAEIACGGADLIKIDFAIAENGIEGLTQYETNHIFSDRTQHIFTFPLLENPDGIICCYDKAGQKHFYYVNKNDNTIQSLDECLAPDECKEEFEQFIASFDAMENNSGRRSSVNEHKLIEKVFKRTLVQKGILYEYQGNQYRDNRTPFNLINALRKCMRLYMEFKIGEGDECWSDEVGGAQGEEIWLLQRICEKNRPFYPLDINHKAFKRECTITRWNKIHYEEVSVFEKGVVKINGFGLSKATHNAVLKPATPHGRWEALSAALIDLRALCWLIENAKENVKELGHEQELQTSPTRSM